MDQTWENIIGLELQSVRKKFAGGKSWWWHLWRSAFEMEQEYRQFLFLIASNPEKTVVPWTQDLDEFWRQHIADRKKYVADCAAICGRLIAHRPYQLPGARANSAAFAETRKLYLAAFGESARRKRRAAHEGCYDSSDPMVFSDNGGTVPHSGHGHHAGHHSGGHHGHVDAGQHAGGGHDAGGHSGHSCGGHSCGGHSCGGHGCGGGH